MKKHNPFEVVVNQGITNFDTQQSGATIYILGDIEDDSWWTLEEDITPRNIKNKLEEIKHIKKIDMFVCSYGGSVVAGNAICNLIRQHKKDNGVTVDAYVSYAASMGSGITTAADNVYIFDNGIYMLHKPLCFAAGNANDLKKSADVLDVHERGLIKNYMNKFKGTFDELVDMLDNETWLDAEQAVEHGFADEVIKSVEMTAHGDTYKVRNAVFSQDMVSWKNKKNKEDGNGMDKENGNNKNVPVNSFVTLIQSESEDRRSAIKSELSKYGIDDSVLNTSVSLFDVLQIVSASVDLAKQAEAQSSVSNFKDEIEKTIESTLGNKMSVEAVAELAKKAQEIDADSVKKAKMYDAIKSSKIDDAIKDGIRSMGAQLFNEDVWRATLAHMDYEQISEVQNSWAAQAEQNLKAGVRVSESPKEFNQSQNGNFTKFFEKE